MKELYSKIDSPFNDDAFIKELIIKYLKSGDIYKFYGSINEIEKEKIQNSFAYDIMNKLKGKSNIDVTHDSNWAYIKKNADSLKEEYRIYLNLKKKEKADLVERFLDGCEERDLPIHFKFAIFDGRLDEIVMLSDEKNIKNYLEIIETVSEEMTLGKIPILSGTYNKKNIGIACENTQNQHYSYTESRIRKFPETLKKFFIENFEQYKELMNEDEVETIEFFIEEQKDDIEYYQNKNDLESLDRVRNNLSVDGLSTNGDELIALAKRCIVSDEKVLDKLCLMYRDVCKIYGYSKDIIFNEWKDRENEIEM